jgi:hypothetical protein
MSGYGRFAKLLLAEKAGSSGYLFCHAVSAFRILFPSTLPQKQERRKAGVIKHSEIFPSAVKRLFALNMPLDSLERKQI